MPFKTVNGERIEMTQEEYDLLLAQLAEANSPAKLEEEVQRITDDLLENSERDIAIALTTIDLVMAAVNNPQAIQGKTKSEIRQIFRDRVIQNLRDRRGL